MACEQNGVDSSSSDEERTHIPAQQQEERTLTDHLNKRLLQSFLNRLEEGSVAVPSNTSSNEEKEDSNEFDDETSH